MKSESIDFVDEILLVFLSESLIDLRVLLRRGQLVHNLRALMRPACPLRHLGDIERFVKIIRQLSLNLALKLLLLKLLVNDVQVYIGLDLLGHCRL